MRFEKVYVQVAATFLREGGLRPTALIWSDGRKFFVERVTEVATAPPHVASVFPVRYTCLIEGREKYLWFEPQNMRWFVELALP